MNLFIQKNWSKKNLKKNDKKSLKILIYGSIRYSKSIEEVIILVKKMKIKFKINVTVAGKHEQDVKKLLSKKFN